MEMPIDAQHQAMGYDRTATMFSPEGHLLQVEYAEKTVRLGSSSIGIVCKDGVLIVADKRIEDKLIVDNSSKKIHEIDEHVITSVAGIISDARVLVDKARVLSQQHRITYDSPIEPKSVIKEIADIQQQFTQYGGARPFGVSMMLAGINGKKPELYSSEITGNYFAYYAHAIGEKDDKIKEKLKEKYKENLTLKQAAKICIDIFKEIKEDKFNIEKLEMAYISIDKPQLKRVEGKDIQEFIK
ncbi:MAG: archaeal proteasome endopeptidase complex subunit alpha [Nanoarchaeota archaeon]